MRQGLRWASVAVVAAGLGGSVGLAACGERSESRERPAPSHPVVRPASDDDERAPVVESLRVAVFNTSLSRRASGELATALATGADPSAKQVATILQVVRPDVVVLLEVDRDPAVVDVLRRDYLEADLGIEGGPLRYAHEVLPTTNTGVASGLDLDRDGRTDGPGDALGFGAYPGQYGMVLLSRFPLGSTRCWGELLWRDVADAAPTAAMPDAPGGPGGFGWYSAEAKALLPLSSKNHCDVTVDAPGGPLHVLFSHPTPPVFDGPENRNGLRNAAEVGLWSDLLDGMAYLGASLPADARFVVAGDLNADPRDGDGAHAAIGRLLSHPRIAAQPVPSSAGAVAAARRDGGANAAHGGPAAHDTADFPDGPGGPGNLRTDYVLPSATLRVVDSGVFWPAPGQPRASDVECSDHRLVWLDVVPKD